MIIYDDESKRCLKTLCLYLTPSEARELADSANELAEDPSKHHAHISDAGYKREFTITVYTKDNFSQFDAESKKLVTDALAEEAG